ncbi:MAG: DUF3800 domain-containing protein [Methanotrichaceae archaeon]
MKVYIDESGNLGGLGPKAAKDDLYFVLAVLVAREEIPILRCIKGVRQTLRKKYKVKSELHFRESDNPSKRRILECVAKTNNDIIYAFLRKDRTDLLRPYLGKEIQALYNDLYMQLLYRVFQKYEIEDITEIVIDRFLYGEAQEKLNRYLEDGLVADLNISHLDSKQCPTLQAVDFIAGAVRRKYMDSDDFYYNKFQNKIAVALEFSNKMICEPLSNRPTC